MTGSHPLVFNVGLAFNFGLTGGRRLNLRPHVYIRRMLSW